jgi:hypothetical protein
MLPALRVAAAVAGGALLLTGCASGNPNTAAVVAGTTITQSQVDAAAPVIAPMLGDNGAQLAPSAVVNVMVQGVVCDEVAKQLGITISDAQREQAFAAESITTLASDPATRPVAIALIDQSIIRSQVGSDEFAQASQKVAVTLNPRYGTWSAASFQIMPNTGSLSKPAPTASGKA